MISVICVYNNRELFDSCLYKSLKTQTAQYQLIAMDNTDGRYRSAAQALNRLVALATEDYILFAHQDVYMNNPDCLEEVEKIVSHIPNLGIAGVAGVKEGEAKKVYSNIYHDSPLRKCGETITSPVNVMTVDECAFLIPSEVARKHIFDDRTCDGWHLYAAEYSIRMNEMMGYNVCVIPVELYHKTGTGNPMNHSYFRCLSKISRMYGYRYNRIYTCSGSWRTGVPFIFQEVWFHIKMAINKVLLQLIDKGLFPERLMRKRWKRLASERLEAKLENIN